MDFVTIRQKLVFIDGDDRDQLNWALRRFDDQSAKLIMVKGAPLDAMTQHQRRFYFDQGGFLVGRFGIHAVPAIVEPDGKVMRSEEHTSELQSLMRISYAVFCLKKKIIIRQTIDTYNIL